jgi:pimeloyl-ACP methyl ester carboxylesterase
MGDIRTRVVHASDGTQLAVEEVGDPEAPMTVVFSHGFCLNMHTWAPQRHHLWQQYGDQIRLVFYDHRGHGASGVADPGTYTLGQLGADLNAVIEATAPAGQIVLAGHSMGGMTILAFANRFPQTLH